MDDIRAKQNVVFSVLAVLCNLLTFALITTSPKLRKLPKFHIITSMSLVNILACLAFFPVDTHFALHNVSHPNDKLRIFLQCTQTYCMQSILSVSLVCLGVDYMVNKVYNIGFQKKLITSVISITVSWGFGLLSLLPFSFLHHLEATNGSMFYTNSSTHIYSNFTAKQGMFHTLQYPKSSQVPLLLTLMTSLWVVLPLVLAFLTSTLCVLLRQINKSSPIYVMSQGNSSSAYNNSDNILEISILDTAVSTVIIIILTIPFYVETLTNMVCTPEDECFVKQPRNRSTELARWSVTFILPALWMLDAEFREAFVLLCGRIGFGSCIVNY